MRFRHRRFGMRRSRDPVMWFRAAQANQFIQITAAAPLTAGTAAVFGGTLLQTGIDERLTLRRLRLLVMYNATATVDADLIFTLGVFFAGVAGTTRDPNIVAAADQQADWLGLRVYPVQSTGAPTMGGLIQVPSDWDIRAQRKVDADQSIVVSAKLGRVSSAALSANQTLNIRVWSSALFSRTRR